MEKLITILTEHPALAKTAGGLIAFIILGWMTFGGIAVIMYFMGALTVILVEVWAFLKFYSRDDTKVNGPLRVLIT